MADQEQRRTVGDEAVPSLAGLVAPNSVAAFLEQDWNKRFRAWPAAAGRFADLVGWDAINALLESQRLEPPRLILVRGGKTISPDQYLHSLGNNKRIDAGAMTALLAQGATMVLSFIDEILPRIAAMADGLAADLGVRANVNLYAGWRVDHGFDLHWDHHDVFILQVRGRKHWRVHRPTRVHPLRSETPAAPGADDVPVFDAVLEEGAVLYIPRGWWHVATPVDEPSLHLTVALTPPNGQDYLRWLADRASASALFRADWPTANGDADGTAHGAKLAAAVQALVADNPPAAFLAAQRAAFPARPHFSLPEFAAGAMARLGDASRLRLAGARALAALRDPVSGALGVHAAGRFFECNAAVAAVLGRLSSAGDIRYDQLAAGLDGDAANALEQLLIRLIAAGVLFVDLPPR